MVRLNLGCADLPLPQADGWVNIDHSTSPHIEADLTADILDLSEHFKPDSVDEIWFSHGIEHLYPNDIPQVIEHWKSLLKPGGTLSLVTPDFKAFAEGYLEGSVTLSYLNDYVLYSYVQEDWHKSMWDQVSLFSLLADHGFSNIVPIDRLADARLAYKDSLQCGASGKK